MPGLWPTGSVTAKRWSWAATLHQRRETVPDSAHPFRVVFWLPHVTLTGKAKLMRIFIGENDRWRGKSLYDAIVESLRTNDIARVTVYRGICGYGAHRRFHKEKRLSLSHDQPIILSVVDEEAKIRAYLPVLEQMSTRPCRAVRRGRHQVHASSGAAR